MGIFDVDAGVIISFERGATFGIKFATEVERHSNRFVSLIVP
jgi:hypothetical protein